MRNNRRTRAAVEALIEQITRDAAGEDAQLWAFSEAFKANVTTLPVEGSIAGERVQVLASEYDGRRRIR